jgi:hypothetical protein
VVIGPVAVNLPVGCAIAAGPLSGAANRRIRVTGWGRFRG